MWYAQACRPRATNLVHFLLVEVPCLPYAEAYSAQTEQSEQRKWASGVRHSATARGGATGVTLIARRRSTSLILRRRRSDVTRGSGLTLSVLIRGSGHGVLGSMIGVTRTFLGFAGASFGAVFYGTGCTGCCTFCLISRAGCGALSLVSCPLSRALGLIGSALRRTHQHRHLRRSGS